MCLCKCISLLYAHALPLHWFSHSVILSKQLRISETIINSWWTCKEKLLYNNLKSLMVPTQQKIITDLVNYKECLSCKVMSTSSYNIYGSSIVWRWNQEVCKDWQLVIGKHLLVLIPVIVMSSAKLWHSLLHSALCTNNIKFTTWFHNSRVGI